uniref:Uncharacterized protein n=1 Tax=Arcella intermedia TaxID=1963864 RepID=A0A6B2LKA6_9EUKA
MQKISTVERKIKFLLQSFSFEEEPHQLDTQFNLINSLYQQLTTLNENLDSGAEDYPAHKTELFTISQAVKNLKDKIKEHKNRNLTETNNRSDVTIEMAALMEERRSIANSNQVAREIIEEAEAARHTVRQNNITMKRINEKTGVIANTYRTAQSFMGAIKRQKLKHTVVIGVTIGVCICFILWWWLA